MREIWAGRDEERETWGRARHGERNRHQIHCFHCLIQGGRRGGERERNEEEPERG